MAEEVSTSPIAGREKAPKTEEEYVKFSSDVWGYVKGSRDGLEYRIREALHFLLGDQWIRYLPYSQKFTKHSLDDWIPTPVTNYLPKHFDRIIDIFISGNMMPVISAAGDDQADIEAAHAAERVLHHEFNRLQTETNLYGPAAGWLVLAGNAVMYAGWNPRSGNKVRKKQFDLVSEDVQADVMVCPTCATMYESERAPERCPECASFLEPQKAPLYEESGKKAVEKKEVPKLDAQGNPIYKEYKMGNVEENVVNLLNFYPMPARTWDRVQYTVETEPMSIEQIKSIFGKKAADVTAESIELEEWSGAHDIDESYSCETESKQRDHALVKWMRFRPNDWWSQGQTIIEANGKILHTGKLDSPDGDLPYELVRYREVPGYFWGASVFTDLIPAQRRVNSVDSHLVQNRKKMVSSQWLVPEGSGVTKIDGRSGLVIPYNPHSAGGYKPEIIHPTPVPQQVVNERSQTIMDMEEMSGAREVLQGDVPPGPETGVAVEHLVEQAYKRFSPSIKQWRAACVRHERRKLLLCAKHWAQQRLVKVLGDNQFTEMYHYSRADLKGAQDMSIDMGSGQAFSATAKMQRVMKAAQQGFLGDIQKPEIRGKLLEKLEIEGFDMEYANDAKKARRVLRSLVQGEEPEQLIPEIDNHQVQFAILREYILTSEFYQLPPEKQEAITGRATQHQQVIQQRQQQAQQAAQAAKGAPSQMARGIQQQQPPQ